MPTTRDILVSSALDTSGDAKESDYFSDSSDHVAAKIYSPPRAHPTRTGKIPLTRTQLAAERKAIRDHKIKIAGAKAEEKKSAIEYRKKAANTKKQEKLVSAAESKARKAASKAEELRKLADGIKAIGDAISPELAEGGPTVLAGANLHSHKRSKGASGTSTTGTLLFSPPTTTQSPQRKADSTKRTSIGSPECSPQRTANRPLLTDGADDFSQDMSFSDGDDDPLVPRRLAEVALRAQGRGGRRYAAPVAREGWGGGRSAATFSRGRNNQGFSFKPTQLHAATRMDASSSEGVISSSSESEDEDSSGQSSRGSNDSYAAKRPVVSAVHQATLDKYECEEMKILEGVWPGSHDTILLTRFVEVHFAGSWEGYLPFMDWADRCYMESPETEILVQTWRVLKSGSCWREGLKQQSAKEGHSSQDYSDSGRETDETEHHHHRKLRRKSGEIDSFKSSISHATDSRITTPPNASAGGAGDTPPVAKQLFTPGLKSIPATPKAAGVQQDIRTMLRYTPTYSPAEEADREAMEEDILQQEREEANKAERIQALRERFEKESQLKGASDSKSREVTWSVETDEVSTTTTPPSTNRGSNFRKATKASREREQALALEAKLEEEKIAAQTQAQEEGIDAASTGLANATHAHDHNQDNTATGMAPATPEVPAVLHQGGSLSKCDFISDLSVLKRDRQGRNNIAPLSEVTPSLSATDSLSAISSTSNPVHRRSVLSGSKYSAVPHGVLPDNGEGEDTIDSNGTCFQFTTE